MAAAEPVGAAAHRIDVGGLTLHVEEHGAGEPVLLLHGFAGSAGAMRPVIAALAARHRVLAPDLVGHGRSDAPHEASAYTWPAVTRQLKRLLDELRIPHAHLLGFSLGGRIALQLAARHEERVRSVVTVGSRCSWPDAAEREARRAHDDALAARIAAEGIGALARADANEDALAAAAPGAGVHGLALALRGLGAADQPDVGAALALSAVPLLLLAGTNDSGPRESARALARDLPCALVVEIARAGHRAHLERTTEVCRLALDFFAQADADRDQGNQTRARRAAVAQGGGRW